MLNERMVELLQEDARKFGSAYPSAVGVIRAIVQMGSSAEERIQLISDVLDALDAVHARVQAERA